jgi:ribosomal-protein-alanine N-acetyltransferase
MAAASGKATVRRARLSDVEGIYRMGCRAWELSFSDRFHFHERSELRKWARKPSENIFLVAEKGGRLAGFILAHVLSRDWCELDNIDVGPEFRGHGIGNALMEGFMREIRCRRVRYVQTLVRASNKRAMRFWKKHGFSRGKTFLWYEEEI